MKKLILLFTASLFLLFPSITCHATMVKPPTQLNPIFNPLPGSTSGAPNSVLPSTLDEIAGFGQSMPTYYFESQGLDLMGDATFEDVVLATEGVSPNTDMIWTHKPFTGVGSAGWLPSGHLYDSEGNEVPVENAGICWGQNDYAYTMFIYDIESGEALRQGENFQSSISTIDAGVKDTFWNTCGQVLGIYGPEVPTSPLAIYNQHLATSEQIEYYNSLPESAYWYDSLHDIGCFVANVNDTSNVFTQENSGYNWVCYYNDTGAVRIWNNWTGGGGWQNVKPQAGNFVINGQSYGYRFPPLGYGFNTTDSKPKFTNANDPEEPDNPNNITIIFYTPQEPYDLPEVVNREKQLKNPVNKHTEPNPDYNVNNNYNYYNFNFTTTTEAPDVAPTTNYYQYIYNYYTTPSEGDSLGDLTEGDITGNLPILSNLQYRFPFSIPFDIYKLFKGMAVQRETPYINTDFVFPRINYTWHIEYDLSEFDDIAELFRTLFLIGFIIGLALYSYDHFFGS